MQTTPFIAFFLKGTTRNPPKESLLYGTPYAAALVVSTVPFAAYSISILYSFYGIGSSFHDAGWSAYLIHESDFLVHNPPCVDDGVSWFNSHISPLFLATSGLGRLLPLTRIQFYAAYIGVSHALPAIAVFWLLMSGYHMTRPVPCFIAALLALFFCLRWTGAGDRTVSSFHDVPRRHWNHVPCRDGFGTRQNCRIVFPAVLEYARRCGISPLCLVLHFVLPRAR